MALGMTRLSLDEEIKKLSPTGGSGAPSGAAGGALTGVYPNPGLAAGVVTGSALGNDVLTTSTVFNGDVTGIWNALLLKTGVVTSGKLADGAATGTKLGADVATLVSGLVPTSKLGTGVQDASHVLSGAGTWITPPGGAPSGAAGGSLSGTYPNPTLANGVATGTKLGTDVVVTSLANIANGYVKPDAGNLVLAGMVGGGTPNSSTFLRGDRTWAVPPGSSSLPGVNVKDYGAVGDGVHDDTVNVQNALDAAGAGATVYFPGTGNISNGTGYKVTSTLHAYQGQSWKGSTLDFCVIFWGGAAHGTLVDMKAGQGVSQFRANGITFQGGAWNAAYTAWADKLIDLTTGAGVVDYGVDISFCEFAQCQADAITIGAWVNFWMNHVRWDAVGGYYVKSTAVSQNGSPWILSDFATDFTQFAGNPPTSKWGFYFDFSGGAGATAPIVFRHGRMEATTGALAASQAFVTANMNTTTGPNLGLHCEDIMFDKGGSITGNFALLNCIGNGGQLSFVFDNIRLGFAPSTNLVIGTTPGGFVQQSASVISHWEYMPNTPWFGNGLTINNLPGFTAGAKYVIVDGNGLLRASALGPAS